MTERQAQPGAGETIFFDDFTGGELDRTQWNVVITGPVSNWNGW